jgi:hypothetical protein
VGSAELHRALGGIGPQPAGPAVPDAAVPAGNFRVLAIPLHVDLFLN